MKSSLLKFAAVAVFAVGMIGCSAPADNANAPATPGASPAASKETKTADVKPASSPATTASADKIGVAECDEFLDKEEACIKDNVPANMRGTFEQSMTAARNSYKTAAATPQGKATLAASCASALSTAKTSFASYNCKW